jgi:hypothetical protein
MRERGCLSTTTLARPRRPCRARHPYAVPRTLFQCVCTRRRNCIGQLSPFSEYAPAIGRFPARRSTIIARESGRLARKTSPHSGPRLFFLWKTAERRAASLTSGFVTGRGAPPRGALNLGRPPCPSSSAPPYGRRLPVLPPRTAALPDST